MTKFIELCPYCNSNLILRDGQYGEFLACPRFPDCKYTRPLKEVEELYRPPSNYCGECNHTGLLPFARNGEIVPNVFIDCECKLSQIEHFDSVQPQPSDIDFPISYDFHRHYCDYYGWPTPKDIEVELPDSNNISIIDKNIRGEGRGIYRELQELKGMMIHTQSKLNEHIDKSKSRLKDGF